MSGLFGYMGYNGFNMMDNYSYDGMMNEDNEYGCH